MLVQISFDIPISVVIVRQFSLIEFFCFDSVFQLFVCFFFQILIKNTIVSMWFFSFCSWIQPNFWMVQSMKSFAVYVLMLIAKYKRRKKKKQRLTEMTSRPLCRTIMCLFCVLCFFMCVCERFYFPLFIKRIWTKKI